MKGVIQSIYFQAHTPIDEYIGASIWSFAASIGRRRGESKKFADMYVQNLTTGFPEDIQIWEHKTYNERPILAPGDGPIETAKMVQPVLCSTGCITRIKKGPPMEALSRLAAVSLLSSFSA